MQAQKKVVIVGDMFELENEAEAEHRKMGALLNDKKFDRVYFCGKLVRAAQATCPTGMLFKKKEELMDSLREDPIENSTILINKLNLIMRVGR
jgi:UDP-N-acetylmuramoyl-tripeptide--D-alanyl-D-alanine ligase